MHKLKIRPSDYDKMPAFTKLLNKRGIQIEIESSPKLALTVEDDNLQEVIRIAKASKIYFDE